jgi:PST family polysaccharide transporter
VLSEVRRYLIPLLRLGGAFVWTSSIATFVTFLVGTTISTTLGVTAFGQYQAAWTVSGVFAQFILVAMGADLLPRLTAAAADKAHLNKLVNEQTEVGLLLSLPGLAATVFFAPIIVRLLFSSEFTDGAMVLPWLVLGVLGRVVTWPLSYLLIAKGESLLFAVAETLTALFQLVAVYLLLGRLQLLGAALAFPLTYIVHCVVGLWSTSRVSGFRWSRDVKLLLISVMLPAVLLVVTTRLLSEGVMVALGCVVCPLVAIATARRLARRLGATHRFVAVLSRHPWAARMLALPES